MAASSSVNPGIRDLITRIELASENVSQGNQEHALTLTPYEKRKLLAATNNLTEKLEGPDTTIWKVVFGVRSSHIVICAPHRGASMNLQYFPRCFSHVLNIHLQTAPSACVSSVSIQDANL